MQKGDSLMTFEELLSYGLTKMQATKILELDTHSMTQRQIKNYHALSALMLLDEQLEQTDDPEVMEKISANKRKLREYFTSIFLK